MKGKLKVCIVKNVYLSIFTEIQNFLGCDEMIAAIAKEKKLLCGNLNAREEIVAESNDDLKEIIEPLNEEEEAAWRG